MNLFNKKLLQQKIEGFKGFPEGVHLENTKKIITGWVKSLKDSDLSKTKEKSVEKSFLIRIFSDVLGYIDMGTSDDTFNLYPDYTIDGLYADGALGFFSKDKKQPLAVIELKDALTSLDKKQTGREKGYTPVEQAYQYSTKLDGCNWIIVSNFREIRIYNKSKSPDYYEKIDVLDLENDKEFKRFFYIFSKANLLTDGNQSSVTDNLLSQSTAQDEDITKAFYKEYKEIRLNFYNHLLEFNSEVEKIVLLEKAQKTLDRLIFVLFCEDTNGLLPLNISKLTYELGKKSRDRSDEKIWREYKNLFMDIDEGRFDIDPPINKYNGGLFKHDEILDNLHIKDSIWDELLRLSKYDFDSDINVNILGHIFEQSISDLESIKAEISGEVQEKSKSKRKKDGIFYTPEYITKYIVENSVGKFLEEHPEKLETIKILDPACGSGSMLNQAHSFLLQEYRNRFEQMMAEKESKNELRTLFDYNPAEVNRGILLNNLFGVDLNQESVEITKLSLWLKTASKVEPLQNLDKNIKCGNSLIDDPEIAGDKAFDWNKEYKEIMDEGGFDVIIGNPPYVRNELLSESDKQYYSSNFKNTYSGKSDLYVYFFEQFVNLLKEGGYGAMIVSSKYTKTKYGKLLINYLNKNVKILEFIDLKDSNVFDGITAYPSMIVFQKIKPVDSETKLAVLGDSDLIQSDIKLRINNVSINVKQNEVFDRLGSWNTSSSLELYGLFTRIKARFQKFGDVYSLPQVGIKTGLNIAYILDSDEPIDFDDPHIKKYIIGKDVKKYKSIQTKKHIIFPYNKVDGKFILADENELSTFVKNHLYSYREVLEKRAIINEGILTGKKKWYEYQQIKLDFDNSNFIIYPDISNGVNFTKASGQLYDMTCFGIETNNSGLLSILNSNLIERFLGSITVKARGGYLRLKSQYISQIPIPRIDVNTSEVLETLVKEIFEKNDLLESLKVNGYDLLSSKYRITNLKSDIFNTGFNNLLDILNNQKIKLTIDEQEELQIWYKSKSSEYLNYKSLINRINNQINAQIYKLYELTGEEIILIENMS